MNIPQELRYTKDHEWARLEGDVVYVGITDYAQGELGEIVYVDVTTEGESLSAEEVFGSIEAVKTVSDLLLPIEGGNPRRSTASSKTALSWSTAIPYGKGWLVKIKPANADDVEGLLSADDYKALIAG